MHSISVQLLKVISKNVIDKTESQTKTENNWKFKLYSRLLNSSSWILIFKSVDSQFKFKVHEMSKQISK